MTEKIMTIENTIQGILKIRIPEKVSNVFGIFAFVILISLGAHIKIFMPGNPVPMTIQTLFVLLAGAILGPRYGALAVFSYVTLGAIGLPLFAAGAAHGLGPTGGYLIGFIFAALLVGLIAHRTTNGFRLAIALILGEITILGLGYINLAVLFRMGFEKAFLIGVLPFLINDALKCAIAWILFIMLFKYQRKSFGAINHRT